MSHQGDDPLDGGRMRRMRELLDTSSFRGALGGFPSGKLSPSDEGAIQFAVGVKDGKVTLDFGTPVAWIGMTPQEAADLASVIIKRAREAALRSGGMVSFTV